MVPHFTQLLLKKSGPRQNNHTIGLMLPGGGMTGVFGGGVMQVLEEMGLSDSFDYIYSGSSGACSAAYLLSHDTKKGASIYSEDLSGSRFIKPWPWGNIMDLDYFCDNVMRKKQLNQEKIRKSPTILKISVTDARTGEMKFYTNKDSVDLISLIKASCTYPGFYQPLVKINDIAYLDGTVMDLFPVQEMIKDGCTDVISVTTFPKDYRFPSFDARMIASRILSKSLGKEYRNKYRHQVTSLNKSLDFMFGIATAASQPKTYVIAPDYYLSPSETNAAKLKKFELHGIAKAKEFFGLE